MKYAMMKTDPASFPRPNMTMREVIGFSRAHEDEIIFPVVVVEGAARGAELKLTKANYAAARRRYTLRHRTFHDLLEYWNGRAEAAFEEGRVNPEMIVNPA